MTAEIVDNRAERQAKAQLEHIEEMVRRLQHAEGCSDHDCGRVSDFEIHNGLNQYSKAAPTEEERKQYHDEDEARQAIEASALSVEVRSNWYMPGCEDAERGPAEYQILLCTGGPAVRITGDLNGDGSEPDTVQLQYQDWFTPWEDYPLSAAEEETLLAYAGTFYYGR